MASASASKMESATKAASRVRRIFSLGRAARAEVAKASTSFDGAAAVSYNPDIMTTAVQTPPMASRGRMTLEEFCALPEGPPNVEFERGRVIPMASPTTRHQDIVLELAHLLKHSPACGSGMVF